MEVRICVVRYADDSIGPKLDLDCDPATEDRNVEIGLHKADRCTVEERLLVLEPELDTLLLRYQGLCSDKQVIEVALVEPQ